MCRIFYICLSFFIMISVLPVQHTLADISMQTVVKNKASNNEYLMNSAYQGPWVMFNFFRGRNDNNGLGLMNLWYKGIVDKNEGDREKTLANLRKAMEYYHDDGNGANVFFFHLPGGAIDPSQMGINQFLSLPEGFRNDLGQTLDDIRQEYPAIKTVIYIGFCKLSASAQTISTCNYDMTSKEMLDVLARRGEFPMEKRLEPKWDDYEDRLLVQLYLRSMAEIWKPDALFLDQFTNNEYHENWEYDGVWLNEIKATMDDASGKAMDYVGVEPMPLEKIGEGRNKRYFLDEEKMAKAPSYSLNSYFDNREPDGGFPLDPHTQLNVFQLSAAPRAMPESEFIATIENGICERGMYPMIAVGFPYILGENFENNPLVQRAKMGIQLGKDKLSQCYGIGDTVE